MLGIVHGSEPWRFGRVHRMNPALLYGASVGNVTLIVCCLAVFIPFAIRARGRIRVLGVVSVPIIVLCRELGVIWGGEAISGEVIALRLVAIVPPLIGAVVIFVLAVAHCRARMRVAGLIGGLLVLSAAALPPVAELLGFSMDVVSPSAVIEAEYRNSLLDFSVAALPGVLLGVGLGLSMIVGMRRSRQELVRN